MTVFLLNGERFDHPGCEARAQDGVLRVWTVRAYGSGDLVASYPLTSVARWLP